MVWCASKRHHSPSNVVRLAGDRDPSRSDLFRHADRAYARPSISRARQTPSGDPSAFVATHSEFQTRWGCRWPTDPVQVCGTSAPVAAHQLGSCRWRPNRLSLESIQSGSGSQPHGQPGRFPQNTRSSSSGIRRDSQFMNPADFRYDLVFDPGQHKGD